MAVQDHRRGIGTSQRNLPQYNDMRMIMDGASELGQMAASIPEIKALQQSIENDEDFRNQSYGSYVDFFDAMAGSEQTLDWVMESQGVDHEGAIDYLRTDLETFMPKKNETNKQYADRTSKQLYPYVDNAGAFDASTLATISSNTNIKADQANYDKLHNEKDLRENKDLYESLEGKSIAEIKDEFVNLGKPLPPEILDNAYSSAISEIDKEIAEIYSIQGKGLSLEYNPRTAEAKLNEAISNSPNGGDARFKQAARETADRYKAQYGMVLNSDALIKKAKDDDAATDKAIQDGITSEYKYHYDKTKTDYEKLINSEKALETALKTADDDAKPGLQKRLSDNRVAQQKSYDRMAILEPLFTGYEEEELAKNTNANNPNEGLESAPLPNYMADKLPVTNTSGWGSEGFDTEMLGAMDIEDQNKDAIGKAIKKSKPQEETHNGVTSYLVKDPLDPNQTLVVAKRGEDGILTVDKSAANRAYNQLATRDELSLTEDANGDVMPGMLQESTVPEMDAPVDAEALSEADNMEGFATEEAATSGALDTHRTSRSNGVDYPLYQGEDGRVFALVQDGENWYRVYQGVDELQQETEQPTLS